MDRHLDFWILSASLIAAAISSLEWSPEEVINACRITGGKCKSVPVRRSGLHSSYASKSKTSVRLASQPNVTGMPSAHGLSPNCIGIEVISILWKETFLELLVLHDAKLSSSSETYGLDCFRQLLDREFIHERIRTPSSGIASATSLDSLCCFSKLLRKQGLSPSSNWESLDCLTRSSLLSIFTMIRSRRKGIAVEMKPAKTVKKNAVAT